MREIANKDVVQARLRGEVRPADGGPIELMKPAVTAETVLRALHANAQQMHSDLSELRADHERVAGETMDGLMKVMGAICERLAELAHVRAPLAVDFTVTARDKDGRVLTFRTKPVKE